MESIHTHPKSKGQSPYTHNRIPKGYGPHCQIAISVRFREFAWTFLHTSASLRKYVEKGVALQDLLSEAEVVLSHKPPTPISAYSEAEYAEMGVACETRSGVSCETMGREELRRYSNCLHSLEPSFIAMQPNASWHSAGEDRTMDQSWDYCESESVSLYWLLELRSLYCREEYPHFCQSSHHTLWAVLQVIKTDFVSYVPSSECCDPSPLHSLH